MLVYDVSRWGRFQDQDQAAYLEFICKQHGKQVVYVTRGFPRDGEQLISHLQISIERYMAAEYSRQLSDKVFHGCVKVIEQGYSAGGTACYGMKRLLLDINKNPKQILERGEHKAISNERVTFVPANNESTRTVEDIFNMYAHQWRSFAYIAHSLNQRGLSAPKGGHWGSESVRRILCNPVYIGTLTYNKRSNRLKTGVKQNAKNKWVIRHDAFPAIVNHDTFSKTQERIRWSGYELNYHHKSHFVRAKCLIHEDVREVLSSLGWEQNLISRAIKELPLVFCDSNTAQQKEFYWCFTLSSSLRSHNNVLGVVVTKKTAHPIVKIFLIPTTNFGLGNFVIISDEKSESSTLQLDQTEFRKKIPILVRGNIL